MFAKSWWRQSAFVYLFFVVLFTCASLLAIAQLRWLDDASRVRLEAERHLLALNAAELMSQLSSAVQVAIGDADAGLPLITNRFYLSSDDQQVQTGDQPDWLATLLERLRGRNGFDLRRSLERMLPYPWIAQVMMDPKSQQAGVPKVHIGLYQIDVAVLESMLAEIVPTTLAGYDFQLVLSGTTLAESTSSIERSQRVLSIPLLSTLGQFLSENRSNQRSDIPGRELSQSQYFVGLLMDLQLQDLIRESEGGLVLDLFRSDGAPQERVAKEQFFGEVFSLATLGLLGLTIVVLLISWKRLEVQRLREQEFVATISHELRTPITVIRSAADNLSQGYVTDAEAIKRYGTEIGRQSQRLGQMVESTLRVSGNARVSGGRDWVEAKRFFVDLLMPLQQLAVEKGKLLTQRISVPTQLFLDRDVVIAIVENLTMNAIIHAHSDLHQVLISVSIEWQHDKELVISVADTGQGLSKREQRRVFKPFVRGKLSEQRQTQGSGLGLYLVQRIVKQNGGRIKVNSPYIAALGHQESGVHIEVILPVEDSRG